MTQAFDRQNGPARKAVRTAARATLGTGLVIAWAVVSLVAMTAPPSFAQTGVKKADAAKELRKKRETGDCKVTFAGFIPGNGGPGVYIEAECPENKTVGAHAQKDKEHAVLSVALSAISTGKLVVFEPDARNEIAWLLVANDK